MNQKTNSWHRDVILEELVEITGHDVIGRQNNPATLTGTRLTRFTDADYAMLAGKVNATGSKACAGIV